MQLQLLRTGFPVRLQGKVEVFGSLPIESVMRVCPRLRGSWRLRGSVKYLVLLLLLLAEVAAVGVVFDNFLAHVVHSVHQELQAFLQVVTGGRDSSLHIRSNTVALKTDVTPSLMTYASVSLLLITDST